MSAEIFWEICPWSDDDLSFGTSQEVRFRRPQIVQVEDLISVCHDLLNCFNSSWPLTIVMDEKNLSEEEEEEPAPILRDEQVLSIRKTYSFPLKIKSAKPYFGESLLCIIHNIPLTWVEGRVMMGSCTWLDFTQPLTGIELKISEDWWDCRGSKKKEDRKIWEMTNSLYWAFQELIDRGTLVYRLTQKKYNLVPKFDSSWSNCVMEDQCQECGQIHSTLPHKLKEVRIGEVSRNYCYCRWKRDRRYPGGIERTFKVIGAYPISPGEADMASCEGSLQADSAYG